METQTLSAQQIKEKYLIAKGRTSGDDGYTELEAYKIPIEGFENLRGLMQATKEYDGTLEKEVHLLSRFRHHISTGCGYDCTGRLCSYSRQTFCNKDPYEMYWYIVIETSSGFDL